MKKQPTKPQGQPPSTRKPYVPPAIESETVFATVATGCSKVVITNPECNVGRPPPLLS